ncbi:MAG: efflux RND transporter periplasmic adaptor subunit [Oscillospiraceae bacterium]|nr:efflux RND transporter periplasmic adaptor subunit [Oscillospiraceae bacterium]
MEKKKKKSKKGLIIVGLILVLAMTGGIMFLRARAARIAAASARPVETIILDKSDMTLSLSVSGVVESGSVTNIYSTLTAYPVQEIFVSVGDRVKVGDVLAILDTTNLENDIALAELNYENALSSLTEEQRTIRNNITNAQNQLESSRIALERQRLNLERAENDLEEALLDAEEPFDSYRYDLSIREALITLERREEDLNKALADLENAIYDFDEYAFLYTINEARIALERRKADVATAEKDLADERAGRRATGYSDSIYQSSVDNAQQVRNQRAVELTLAQEYLEALEADPSSTADEIQEARYAVGAAEMALINAEGALSRAYSEWNAAGDSNSVSRDNAIRNAERTLETAKRNQDDAQRVYDKAVSDLERAKNDAVENYELALERAQNAYDDAQRQYENAINDKERAMDDYITSLDTKITNTRNAVSDSRNQVQSAETSVASAQNSLNQASSRPTTGDISIRTQELNLERLNNSLANGTIVATADGVITESNIRVGAPPSGILFVIEDTEDLYVTARVREYNLTSLDVGQDTEITTDASAGVIFQGVVTYISPKAVSAAGSTSVEFELKSQLLTFDSTIRIGMNAFLNIIMETREEVYSVPASILVSKDDGEYVYAIEEGETIEILVETGLRTSTNTEIFSDELYDGMELLLDPEGRLSSDTRLLPFWMR